MKWSVVICAVVCTAAVCSCGEYEPEDVVDIKDELKINAYLLDDELEENGYWEYIKPEDRKKIYDGYWITDDGQLLEPDEVFALERLEVGEVRTLAPLNYYNFNGGNIIIWLDCDDIIEFETIPNDDYTVQVAYSLDEPDRPDLGNWIEANSFRMRGPAAVNICPIGFPFNEGRVVTSTTLVDHEYNFIVRTYNESDELLVTAKLRLVSVEDEGLPDDYVNNVIEYSPNAELTRFLTVELVSYEYSDIYKLDESSYEEE